MSETGKEQAEKSDGVETGEAPFTPPPQGVRERYHVETERIPNRPGTWDSTLVKVMRGETQVAEYTRNYAMMSTFEAFVQHDGAEWREYALISRSYTKTAVLDLATGEVIAEEDESYYGEGEERPGAGFCPSDLHVPDWWDVHDGSILPGSRYWDEGEHTWPRGEFGYVAGCHWGDDAGGWKVQHLDLTRIREGTITRDDRYGYVELPHQTRLRDAVRVDPESRRVELAVLVRFDLETGTPSRYSIEGMTDPRYRRRGRPGDET